MIQWQRPPQEHVRTLTAEKPLKRKICGRAFGQPSDLVVHMRAHLRPVLCRRSDFNESFICAAGEKACKRSINAKSLELADQRRECTPASIHPKRSESTRNFTVKKGTNASNSKRRSTTRLSHSLTFPRRSQTNILMQTLRREVRLGANVQIPRGAQSRQPRRAKLFDLWKVVRPKAITQCRRH